MPIWKAIGMEKLINPRDANKIQIMLQKYKNVAVINAYR